MGKRVPRKFRINPGSGGLIGRASEFKKQTSGNNNAAAHSFAGNGGGGPVGGGGGGGGGGAGESFFPTGFDPNKSDTNITFAEENRLVTFADFKTGTSKSVFGARVGKYYWELEYVDNITPTLEGETTCGIATTSSGVESWVGNENDEWAFYAKTGDKINTSVFEAYGDPYSQDLPNIIGVALDLDSNNGTGILWFSFNGVWQNGATLNEVTAGDSTNAAFDDIMSKVAPGDDVHAAVSCAAAINQAQWRGNFGNVPFVYPAPGGFAEGFGDGVAPPPPPPPPVSPPPGDTLVVTAFDTVNGGLDITYSNNDLTADWDTGSSAARAVTTLHGTRSQKFYSEFTYDSNESTVGEAQVGLQTATTNKNNWIGASADGWSYYALNGQKINGAAFTAYGDSYGVGDIIGIALDLDNDAVWFSKNGVWQGGATLSEIEAGDTTNAAFTGVRASTVENIHMGASSSGAGSRPTYTGNFGNTILMYPVPTGFQEGFGDLV